VDAGPVHLLLPQLDALAPLQLVIALAALVMVFRLHWSVLRTLSVSALLGLIGAVVAPALL
jgi:chromate transporter